MEIKTAKIKERENLIMKLNRSQFEALQKGVNKLLSSTQQSSKEYIVELDGSDDIITLEMI